VRGVTGSTGGGGGGEEEDERAGDSCLLVEALSIALSVGDAAPTETLNSIRRGDKVGDDVAAGGGEEVDLVVGEAARSLLWLSEAGV
jgi:hypothetical protein